MSHDDEAAIARGRFFAKIDRVVSEVSMTDLRAYLPPIEEEDEGVVSPVELMGDWSWRPENQVKDPGYTFTKDEIAKVNEMYMGLGTGCPRARDFALRFALLGVPPRPWLVPAHVGFAERPPRLNCIR